MHVLKPRSRMISIRLSEDEYEAMRSLCVANGARSVSHLARDAMHLLLKGSAGSDGIGARMDEFRTEIRTLEKKIDELPSRLSAPDRIEKTHD